jgi:hypothetical protein
MPVAKHTAEYASKCCLEGLLSAWHIKETQSQLKLYNCIIKRDAWERLSALYLTAVDTKKTELRQK